MQPIRLAAAKLIVENRTVGTSSQNATQANRETPLQDGARVKADSGNAGTLYVGNEKISSSKGYPLEAGEEVFVPIDQLSKLYVIASQADQDYYVIAS